MVNSDRVRFVKGEDPVALRQTWDRIYVTTLFSFEWKRISAAIDFALVAMASPINRIFVGGIAASLMHERFLASSLARSPFHQGPAQRAACVALQLDEYAEEFYSDD